MKYPAGGVINRRKPGVRRGCCPPLLELPARRMSHLGTLVVSPFQLAALHGIKVRVRFEKDGVRKWCAYASLMNSDVYGLSIGTGHTLNQAVKLAVMRMQQTLAERIASSNSHFPRRSQ